MEDVNNTECCRAFFSLVISGFSKIAEESGSSAPCRLSLNALDVHSGLDNRHVRHRFGIITPCACLAGQKMEHQLWEMASWSDP